MKFNNLNDSYLDKINNSSQTQQDVAANYFRIIPRGVNADNSIILYYNRKNYEKYLNNKLQESNVDIDSLKDFIYEHTLYGKVDKNNNAITITKNSLKSVDMGNNFMLANVAADAFEQFLLKYNRIVNSRLIPTNSSYSNLVVKKGYSSPHSEYNDFINNLMNQFFIYVKDEKIKNNIIDYPTTIKYFIYFYNMNYKDTVFNKSEFIKTKFCSPNISGLIVEFSKDNHGDDNNKYNKYTEDESYIPFQNLVKEFGFTLDRHAPWRMVFDIGSQPATRYLSENYQISSTEVYFGTNYYLSDYFDYESFKINMYNLYIFIAEDERSFKIPKFNLKNNKICINQKIVNRNLIQYTDINQYIDENSLLKMFFYIKCKENNIISSEVEFERHCDEILSIYRYKGIIDAIDLMIAKCRINKNKGNENLTINFL